ncbi:uncharacterized protein LOC125653268 [Ostrea edulis]|uniref:uncharacterized protein LOC125653268 n=1 Tax=Ostrea edulis TaxID=37623 RepID=UPI0024AF83E9|nr:uncharacterized protein LOC125653268 [Ostrea edulis]
MGFIIGITLAIAAVLFICSVFGRQLCKRGQASQNSSDASGSDPGLVNNTDRDHGSFVMHSSPTVSSSSLLSEDEDSVTSSGKSLLHTHDDCKTFLTLLHARRHYPSEPPPPYQYVMRNKDKYPLREDIIL